MTDLPKVTLYSTVGGSDKVYCLEIKAQGDGYVVNFANGRRGGTLQHGTKTQNPVKLDAAQKIYDKVYKEKTGKGYTVGEGERAFTGTDMANRVSGLLPQLSNAITRAEMEAIILDPRYMLQEKKDGNRTMVRKTDAAEGINRKGLTIPLPKEVAAELELLGGALTLDGELVDQVFWAFDCLVSPLEGDVTKRGVKERYDALVAVVGSLDGLSKGGLANVKLVEAAFTTAEKRALFDRVEAEGGEGVVAKLITAAYEPGRPAKGGNHLKFKFRESASVIVLGVNDKRSVRMAVLDESGQTVEIGNVTIPPNKDVPKAGDLIEVSYLYAFRGGSLFQPTYHGPRTDIERGEAGIGQLKFKDA